MLLTRVLTAIVLLLVLLPLLFLSSVTGWRIAVVLALMVAAWEWARLARLDRSTIWIYVLATAMAGAAVELVSPSIARSLLGVGFVFWLVAVPLMFATGGRPAGWLGALVGWCVLLPFAVALNDLRDRGPWLLVSVMALVWIADIAAYFAGRAFGRRKLAPTISPGKTWEGVCGAVVAVGLYAWANLHLHNPLLTGQPGWLVILMAGGLMTAVSVLGDLFESAMKRSAGMKDSSQLLPGHGGVLDRIDSLTSTLPVTALLLIWSDKL